MSKKIGFAVVGMGHIGKRHATMIEQHEEAELMAVCDVLPKAALGIETLEVPFFRTLTDLLEADLSIDVVCICTPNGWHAEHSIAVLEASKHVVCEKPMALTKESCEAVIYKALQHSRQVFCVMQNRYSPPAVWLKEVMQQQLLGDIFLVQINCYWNRDDRYYYKNGKKHPWKGSTHLDGGPLFTQFSHFVDILYWLFGDIKKIQARFDNFTHQHSTDFEDTGIVNFDLINGGVGSFSYSTAVYDQNLESSLTVIGSKGSIQVGGQYMNKVNYCHIQDYEMPTLEAASPANDYGTYKGSANNHIHVIQNVIDVLKGRKVIATNALEGLKVVEMIEKIYEQK